MAALKEPDLTAPENRGAVFRGHCKLGLAPENVDSGGCSAQKGTCPLTVPPIWCALRLFLRAADSRLQCLALSNTYADSVGRVLGGSVRHYRFRRSSKKGVGGRNTPSGDMLPPIANPR